MRRLLAANTTCHGHTAKIAERIAHTTDCAVDVCDLARRQPDRPLGEYDGAGTQANRRIP